MLVCPMKPIGLLAIIFFLSLSAHGQLTHDTKFVGVVDFEGFSDHTFIADHYIPGGGIDIIYHGKGNWSRGLILTGNGSQNFANKFSLPIGQADLGIYDIGWVDQYDFFITKKFGLNIFLINGCYIAKLHDDSDLISQQTRYGLRNYPKLVGTNVFFSAEPGLALQWRCLFDGFYLTAKIKYKLLVGGTEFGEAGEFSGYDIAGGFIFRFINK